MYFLFSYFSWASYFFFYTRLPASSSVEWALVWMLDDSTPNLLFTAHKQFQVSSCQRTHFSFIMPISDQLISLGAPELWSQTQEKNLRLSNPQYPPKRWNFCWFGSPAEYPCKDALQYRSAAWQSLTLVKSTKGGLREWEGPALCFSGRITARRRRRKRLATCYMYVY